MLTLVGCDGQANNSYVSCRQVANNRYGSCQRDEPEAICRCFYNHRGLFRSYNLSWRSNVWYVLSNGIASSLMCICQSANSAERAQLRC
jgi:hypothetical protein